jgi:AraC-like DNA-binding protein
MYASASRQEKINFWHDPTLSNLELLHATYITHRFAPHTHESYVIGVIEQGAEQFMYRGRKHVAPAGSLVFINPGEMHTGSSATPDGWTYRTLYPSTTLLQSAASDLIGGSQALPFFAEAVVHNAEMSREISLMHHALETRATTLERESTLLWTLTRLVLRYADHHPHMRPFPKEHAGIQRVRTYLDEHYSENISLTQLAAIAQLSPFHLLRAFREQVGLPPHTYHLQRRVMHAKHLLAQGQSCVDVALAVGFADQSHFTKNFKRIVGVSPGRYSNYL